MPTLTRAPTTAPPAFRGAAPEHLLGIGDLPFGAVRELVDHALELKTAWARGLRTRPLEGRVVALLFEQPSLRTRVSFEVGLTRLGASSVTLTGAEIGLGRREPTTDVARSLSRYVDAIAARILEHETLEELAGASTVPVVNALTGREHPCQAIADLVTLTEHLGPLAGCPVAFVGDGANNVATSFLLAAARMGMHLRVASPERYAPKPGIVAQAVAWAARTGGSVSISEDPHAAVEGVEAVYTDTWTSMGTEREAATRRRHLEPYRLDRRLLAGARTDVLVMHCLPAHRGEEIEASLLDGAHSVAFDQAENRMTAQQAILLRLLEPGVPPPLRS